MHYLHSINTHHMEITLDRRPFVISFDNMNCIWQTIVIFTIWIDIEGVSCLRLAMRTANMTFSVIIFAYYCLLFLIILLLLIIADYYFFYIAVVADWFNCPDRFGIFSTGMPDSFGHLPLHLFSGRTGQHERRLRQRGRPRSASNPCQF